MSGQPPPPPPPPPPPVVTSRSIWEPGGDPAQLRQAATAWRAMAVRLRAVSGAIGPAASGTARTWKGDASDAFNGWWADIDGGVTGAADMFDEVAGNLDEIAAEIQRVNDEIQDLYVAVAATVAVSIAASFITFGASAAAGAALAARNAATAANLVRTLGTFLTGMRVTFTSFKVARFGAFWGKWVVAAGTNTAVTGGFKLVMNGDNPFDRDSWSVRDATGIVVGSTIGAGATGLAPGLASRPFATGFGSGAAGSTVNDLWVNDRSFGVDTLRNALINGVASGTAGSIQHGVLNRWGGAPARTTGPMDLDAPDIFVPGRPVPGDPGDLIIPGRVTPGDPTSLVRPGSTTAGDPGDLVIPGRPMPGDPTSLIRPGTPTPGDPADLFVAGRGPAPVEGPARIYLPGDPAPRPIVAAPPVSPLQAIPDGHLQKTIVNLPLNLTTRIAKDPFTVQPLTIPEAGSVTAPTHGPWPAPPPADRVLVSAP